MTAWREILAALKDDTIDAPEGEAIAARAAARLATDRGTAGHRPGIEEVLLTQLG
ncbi:hypothetical protein [Streptomyces sp. NPDC055243]|uniref:hypothetical protein n=1 Tax=Streptomyces sp. NPDC055243 TaxID=3365720 RepID=UPI0037D72C16